MGISHPKKCICLQHPIVEQFRSSSNTIITSTKPSFWHYWCCPSYSHFIELLILQRHLQILHNAIGESLNIIRETHWIVKGRETVKKVLCRCVICKKFECKPTAMVHASQLPSDWISALTMTGLDFAWQLYVQSSGNLVKHTYVYIYLWKFICTWLFLHMQFTWNSPKISFPLHSFWDSDNLPAESVCFLRWCLTMQ